MPDSSAPPERRLLVLATIAGMGAIIALPMSAAAPGVVRSLVFCLPITLVLTARMHGRRWQRNAALVLMALLVLALVPGLGLLAVVPTAVVLFGPVVAVIAVGAPLRDTDLPAAAGFLLSSTIAVIAGFAASDLPGSPAMILGVALVGITVVLVRIGRQEPR